MEYDDEQLAKISTDAASDIVDLILDGDVEAASAQFADFYEENAHQPLAIMSTCTLLGFAAATCVAVNGGAGGTRSITSWASFLTILNIRACNDAFMRSAKQEQEKDDFMRIMRDNFEDSE